MKYATRPKARWCDDLETEVAPLDSITVIEEGDKFEPTGLIDRHGDDICRVKPSIGFLAKH